ncbi:hypothetical protein RclHR1_16410001 [Rhizophagus clarus]|uniref:Uncharacterized protein n=1 Tax=Rhizophagus clarus TaxID=94130 RepID=A0A2Z6QJ06_9GLOM|nr:hypothetical protein RclHR1_16410001 [Rhizophagus clarus]
MATYPIDWSSTSQWLRKNNDNSSPCSFQNDKTTGHKIKLYTHLLPTADIQQRNYPRLYPAQPILCSECSTQVYNNSHIGYCLAHLMELNDSLRLAATYLILLITSSPNAPPSTRDVISSIERSVLFSPVTDIHHSTYLLFHQLKFLFNTFILKSPVNSGKYTPTASIRGKNHATSPKRRKGHIGRLTAPHASNQHVTLWT